MEKINGTSMNLVQENIKKLKEIFPEVFVEGNIDFDVLKEIFGEKIESSKERYSLNWNGKSKARQLAQEVSTGTLRPSKEESKNWDNTENIYIEGDNLEVLKLLQKSYHGKIKMIYIDPPYNTGKDFVYKDNFKDNIENYKKVTGQVGEGGVKLTTNAETSGRYHSDWLNMMYPRLKLARNLLTDDGVIFISIDDNEQANLKKLCDEIFGEENTDILVWQKTDPWVDRNTNSKQVSRFLEFKEYIFIAYKNKNRTNFNKIKKIPDWKNSQKNIDRDPRGNWQSGIFSYEEGHKNEDKNSKSYFEITTPNGKKYKRYWFCKDLEEYKELEKNGYLYFGKSNDSAPRLKIFENIEKEFNLNSILRGFGTSSSAKNELFEILGNREIFDTPKPTKLLKELIRTSILKEENIILDFFSGSATTAHSVMQLNAEDGGNRKYIMVQLPELCKEDSEAYKAGYKNICEIGKERIRRAGDKIRTDESLPLENREKLDIGFKVFKLDSSNIKEWDTSTNDLQQSLLDSIDSIKSNRNSLDVLYEILLKYGLDLNIPIKETENFYSIGGGTLLVSLNNEIDLDVINSICEEYKKILEIDKEFKTTVILKDSSFKNDVDKTNALKKLEQVGISEIRSI